MGYRNDWSRFDNGDWQEDTDNVDEKVMNRAKQFAKGSQRLSEDERKQVRSMRKAAKRR